MKEITFKSWYKTHSWWYSPKDEMEEAWDILIAKGFTPDEAADLLDGVIGVMRNEYGE